MTLLRGLLASLRNLAEGRPADSPRFEPFPPGPEPAARPVSQAQARQLAASLRARLPAHLYPALELVISRSSAAPADRQALFKAVSAWRAGLGVAIGRGGAPGESEELLYRHLVELERWMEADLRDPDV